jgi:transcriptional regulator with XRE-family HTH domain
MRSNKERESGCGLKLPLPAPDLIPELSLQVVSSSAVVISAGGAVDSQGRRMKQSKEEKKRRFKEAARLKFAGIVDTNGSAERLSAPAEGYVRWMREGLGQTREAVADKMHIAPQSLAGYEEAEAAGTIRLDTLRRAALALNCTVVYALVPVDMFKPRERIQDIGAVLDEMAELTQRARRQVEQPGPRPPALSNSRREPIRPIILREWEEDPSPSP